MLDRIVIYESNWVSLYSDKVKMPDGRIFDTYHKLHYPHESVSVVIINENAERRECLEETGCTLKDLTYLCCHNPSNGMSDLKFHVFAAKVDTETSKIDENEVNEKRWLAKDKVLDMLKANETHCGISMLSLLYAIQFYI